MIETEYKIAFTGISLIVILNLLVTPLDKWIEFFVVVLISLLIGWIIGNLLSKFY